jgi:hypothetical protein
VTLPETVIIELTATELSTIRDALDRHLVATPVTAVRARVLEAQAALNRQAPR